MIILITNVLFYLVNYIAVQFIFTPSPNIGVYQLAHYQCSVDNTNVAITWYINETITNNTIHLIYIIYII